MLRHSFAREVIQESQGDPYVMGQLAAMLGHSSVAVTQRYYMTFFDEAEAEMLVENLPIK